MLEGTLQFLVTVCPYDECIICVSVPVGRFLLRRTYSLLLEGFLVEVTNHRSEGLSHSDAVSFVVEGAVVEEMCGGEHLSAQSYEVTVALL
jgi:hypothetical protein